MTHRLFFLLDLSGDTGNESGVIENLSYFIRKTFIIRKNNNPDEKGEMKLGQINYLRKSDDSFIQFIWFALESGSEFSRILQSSITNLFSTKEY